MVSSGEVDFKAVRVAIVVKAFWYEKSKMAMPFFLRHQFDVPAFKVSVFASDFDFWIDVPINKNWGMIISWKKYLLIASKSHNNKNDLRFHPGAGVSWG